MQIYGLNVKQNAPVPAQAGTQFRCVFEAQKLGPRLRGGGGRIYVYLTFVTAIKMPCFRREKKNSSAGKLFQPFIARKALQC
jgi:hypothetical protein